MNEDEMGPERFFEEMHKKHKREVQKSNAQQLKTYHLVFGADNYNQSLFRCAVDIVAMDLAAWAGHLIEEDTPKADKVFRAIADLRLAILAAACPDMLDINTGTVSSKMLAALRPIAK